MEKHVSSGVPFTIIVKALRIEKTASRLAAALVAICGDIDSIRTVDKSGAVLIREYRVVARSHAHMGEIVRAVNVVPGSEVVGTSDWPVDSEFESLAVGTDSLMYALTNTA